jgi:hypothetical protein
MYYEVLDLLFPHQRLESSEAADHHDSNQIRLICITITLYYEDNYQFRSILLKLMISSL